MRVGPGASRRARKPAGEPLAPEARIVVGDGEVRVAGTMREDGAGHAVVRSSLLFEAGQVLTVERAGSDGARRRARVVCAVTVGEEMAMEIEWVERA